ncbi:hypothetical protein FB107DRAFT_223993, partial [Schizophyllum commune]
KLNLLRKDPRMVRVEGHSTLTVRKTHVFEDTYAFFERYSDDDLKKYLRVTFDGRSGSWAFGQWLTSISHDLVRPDRGPFAPASPGNAILELNPLLSSSLRPSLDIARFAGRCVGVLIMYKRVLDAAIAPHFFKTLMGRRPGLEDLEAVDGELYRALGWMLENDITGVLFETFAVREETRGTMRTVELCAGGERIAVTEANKAAYVDARVQHRLFGRVMGEVMAFRDGLTGFVPIDLLQRFSDDELSVVFCGKSTVNITTWEQKTEYIGYTPSDPVIAWFWDVVRGLSDAQRAKLLSFVTGSPRVPVGGFERSRYSAGPERFVVERAGDASSKAWPLPSSHACTSTLHLPPYPDRATLERKLVYAIE